MVKNKLIRISVLALVACSMVGIFVIPAFASAGAGVAGINRGVTQQAFWHGYVDVYLTDTDNNDLIVRMDLPQMLAYAPNVDETDILIYGGEVPVSEVVATSDIHFDFVSVWSDYDDYALGTLTYGRIQFGYRFDDCTINKVVYVLEPLTFYYFSDFFNSIYVCGDGSYSTRVDCDYIGSSEKLPRHVSKTYQRTVGYNSSANNNKNFACPLTGTQQQDFFSTPNLPYSTTLMKVGLTITWTPERDDVNYCELVVPCIPKSPTVGFPYEFSAVGDSSNKIYLNEDYWDAEINDVITYWWQDEGDLPEQTDFFGWIAKSVSSFFDARLFGDVSIGDIAYVIIGFSLVFWLLKFFAGG